MSGKKEQPAFLLPARLSCRWSLIRSGICSSGLSAVWHHAVRFCLGRAGCNLSLGSPPKTPDHCNIGPSLPPSPHQGTFGHRGVVEAGFTRELHLHQADRFQEGQEILSRYGPALSPGPTGDPFVGILRKFTRERLIGHHKPTSRFQNPEHLSKGQDEHLELLPWHWR